jgi:hypothetical protein
MGGAADAMKGLCALQPNAVAFVAAAKFLCAERWQTLARGKRRIQPRPAPMIQPQAPPTIEAQPRTGPIGPDEVLVRAPAGDR